MHPLRKRNQGIPKISTLAYLAKRLVLILNTIKYILHGNVNYPHFYRISQEWHQKIENWLQSNDYDEKFNDEYKRKRRLANISRRPLENDSGNDILTKISYFFNYII